MSPMLGADGFFRASARSPFAALALPHQTRILPSEGSLKETGEQSSWDCTSSESSLKPFDIDRGRASSAVAAKYRPRPLRVQMRFQISVETLCNSFLPPGAIVLVNFRVKLICENGAAHMEKTRWHDGLPEQFAELGSRR